MEEKNNCKKTSIRPLGEGLQKVANDKFFETENSILENLELIKDWIRKNPHLNVRMDDQFLIGFIRSCKYRMELVKQKIDSYYTIRTHLPELWRTNKFDEKSLAILKSGCAVPLLTQNDDESDMPKIVFIRGNRIDLDQFSLEDVIKCSFTITELALKDDDRANICGTMSIVDLAGVKITRLLRWILAMPITKIVKILQDGSISRFKGAHYINATKEIHIINDIFKKFHNDKVNSRVRNLFLVCKKLLHI